MTNFFAGAIIGFLACAWAYGTPPRVAAAVLWQNLEKVQQTSAAAYEAYDAKSLAKAQRNEQINSQKADYR